MCNFTFLPGVKLLVLESSLLFLFSLEIRINLLGRQTLLLYDKLCEPPVNSLNKILFKPYELGCQDSILSIYIIVQGEACLLY